MKRKIVMAVLIAAMVGSMAGCGKTAADTTDTAAASAAEENTDDFASAPEETDTAENTQEEETQGEEPQTTVGSAAPVDADSWKIIQDAGLTNVEEETGKMSVLSYTLDPSTLQDEGDYYTINATFAKPMTISGDMQVGDTVTVTTNELTGETDELTLMENNILTDPDGAEYYFVKDDTAGADTDIFLYYDSDDRLDSNFYEGTLCISKDAKVGIAIANDYSTITADSFSDESNTWYNGVYFDDNGVVTQLIFYGD